MTSERSRIYEYLYLRSVSAKLAPVYYEKTEELGRMMGLRGHGLVFGGGATGLMGAAARGVDAHHGYIRESLPHFLTSRAYFTNTVRSLYLPRRCGNARSFWKNGPRRPLWRREGSALMKSSSRS